MPSINAPRPQARVILLFSSAQPAARALNLALTGAGYRVITAGGESDALFALEHEAVDLLLVHLHSTNPERLDVVKLQRMSDPSAPRLPVIVLAEMMSAELEQACADAHVDLRLTSPVEPRLLLDSISELLLRHPPR
jgi:response regulator RpfG family c-di-GMP phosphodiesterase